MRVLVDMDGVLADFEQGVYNALCDQYSHIPHIPLEQRTTFHVKAQYPPEHQSTVEAIYVAKGFYANLSPVAGSLEALTQLREQHDIFICTSPLLKNKHCIPEKYEWVEKHLGREWLDRVVITKDKTLVLADILVDDNPTIEGCEKPTWEHILYDQPYNRSVDKRRLTWRNWRDVLC
ncbi:5'-3'-deoxyribonucleotidase [Candidatus Woesearchaeota archaeon]|nr:5'-3'-deoxyribonucleotidase [Candidatus Woesearchaeota archaeon]